MNKKKQDDLLSSLSTVDFSIVYDVIKDKLGDQILPERLKLPTDEFLESEQPLKDIIVFHQKCFGVLYMECKKGSDPFIKFQFHWHHSCNALLLAGAINCRLLNWKNHPATL